MTSSHVSAVLPNDIDDPRSPSGGNGYDRRVLTGLRALGFRIQEHGVRGTWPEPSGPARAEVARLAAAGGLLLVDGLVASAVPDLLLPVADRVVVLVHRPLGGAAEAALFAAARGLVVPSDWAARQVTGRVRVAPPGVDPAPLAPGSADGTELLCVAAVTRGKGYDVLVSAVAGMPCRCLCVGPLDRDPAFATALPRPPNVRFAGPLTGADLAAAYAGADLLVLPTREETYGMVLTEALARGIPVLASAVGGVPEAVGRAPDGHLPGMLVEPDDAGGVAAALGRWLGDPVLRARLRTAARERRETLTGWDVTTRQVAAALT